MNISENDFNKKMKKMRKSDTEFNELVEQIERKIQQAIFFQKSPKKFSLRKNIYYNINIKVNYSKSITREQEVYLLNHIQNKYIKFFSGDFFIIERCFLLRKYRIKICNLCDSEISIS